MGMLAKMTTARISQPVSVPAPGWLSQPNGTVLTDREYLAAACMSAVVQTDVGRAESPALVLKGKTPSSRISGSSLRSLLHVRRGPSGARISCGAVQARGAFIPDWELQAQAAPGGQVTLTVVRSRTLDGKLINGNLLIDTRDQVIRVLSGGSPVTGEAGPPEVAKLVRSSVMRAASWLSNDASPFTADHYLPVPEAFTRQPRISLPEGGADAAARAAFAAPYPAAPGAGSCLAVLDLSGGRRTEANLAIIADQDGERIEIRGAQDAFGVGAQRTFRAALLVLRRLVILLEQSDPPAGQAIGSFIEACLEPYHSPGRVQQFQPLWNKETPADVVPAGPGLPVAIAVQTTATDLFDRLLCAEAWLLIRQRYFNVRSGRTKSYQFASRRPAFLKGADGKLQGVLRYMNFNGAADPDKYGSCQIDDPNCYFWECRIRSQPGGAVLVVDAISQTDELIGYGAELLALLRAFCWGVSAVDPAAQFTTIHV